MNALEKYLNTNEGMTLLASNQDEITVTCKGLETFKYNSKIASNIYISSNSWIGFGTTTEQMKICRRDAKFISFYQQELIILDLKCMKYRWDGYSVYSSTANVNKLTWELFVFDNNDIFLNCIDIPTNGTHAFDLLGGTGTFTPGPNKYISIYCEDKENGKIFNLVEELYTYTDIEIRYLLKDDNGLYKVNEDNSSLVKLEETELSSLIFTTHGMTDIPNGNFAKDLVNPKLLEWHSRLDVDVKLKASVKAIPNRQKIIQNYDSFYSDETIKGIKSVEVIGYINEFANVRFAITFDNVTYYTFANDVWSVIDIADQEVFLTNGMTKKALESLTQEQLESIFLVQDVFKFRIAMIIDYLSINAICSIEQIKINFIN